MREKNEDRHDSDEEEFKAESKRMEVNEQAEEYRERGLDYSDFFSE